MKKGLFIGLVWLAILSGCSFNLQPTSLLLVGDIDELIKVDTSNQSYPFESFVIDQKSYQRVSVEYVLRLHELDLIDYRVFADGSDQIEIDLTLDGWLLTNQKQWFVMSDNYLVEIERLIIKKKQPSNHHYIYQISTTENIDKISVGQLWLSRDSLSMSTWLSPNQQAIAMSRLGHVVTIDQSVALQLEPNSVSLIDRDGNLLVEQLVGWIIDPPPVSNLDVFDMVIPQLLSNQSVMVILIDGLGYLEYQWLLQQSAMPFLSNYDAQVSYTVYKPVTNSGLAAILTGQPPLLNGILNRSYRQLFVPTMLDVALNMDKKVAYIEGNIAIIQTKVEPILNIDRNNDGDTDDEVYASAMSFVAQSDLLFVHFHGFDDIGHVSGVNNDLKIEKINQLDRYIENLVQAFNGLTIIVSDHGMHQQQENGYHGEYKVEDMIVPLILINPNN